MGTLKEYAEFEAILKEGEVNDQLFIIITGTASIAMENTFLGVLDVGQHFGEMAMFEGKPARQILSLTRIRLCFPFHTKKSHRLFPPLRLPVTKY